jgi:uncharacterized protein (DUF1697 family)
MNQWIVLFRGINVGGHNIVPMKELKSALGYAGCENVATYIQSGNVVLEHAEAGADKLANLISETVIKRFGFEPRVLLLTADQLREAHRNNPFPEGKEDPKTLHLYFLANDPTDMDGDALNNMKISTERYELIDRVFYLHAPDGIGRSKLAARVEKCLGVPATARNWRTVEKILQLATA